MIKFIKNLVTILESELNENSHKFYTEEFINDFTLLKHKVECINFENDNSYLSRSKFTNFQSANQDNQEDLSDLYSITNLNLNSNFRVQNSSDIEEHEKWNNEYFRDDHGYLYYLNYKNMAIQKDLFNIMLKRVGSNLISGKGVMNITFPVKIFSYETLLTQ